MSIKSKVLTTDAEIDAAIAASNAAKSNDPELQGVRYIPEHDVLLLHLTNGSRHFIARENLQGLQNAKCSELSRVDLRIPAIGR